MSLLRISPDLSLPIDVVTDTFAILAVKRAGKSNAAVVLAEEMYDAQVPWVAVDPKGDWWGVRAAGDGQAEGLSVLVIGGQHADVPLEPTAGNLVADLIVDQRITCVLDVSEMSKADQRRFLTDFAARLYKRNEEPLHVFCEEADEYIPQRVMGETAKLVGAFETLVKRGGFRGIGVTLITQRSASLNKDVLTQAGTLIAMRTPSPQDRKAVLAWIDYHAASHDVIDELPTLRNGEAWMFSTGEHAAMSKLMFRRRRTFDSGATPKVGGKPRPPARLADVDVAAIKEAMAETIERAKADDPRELRKQIAELTKSVDQAYKDGYDTGKMHADERVVEVITVEQLTRLDAALAGFATTAHDLAVQIGEEVSPLGVILDRLARTREQLPPIEQGTPTRVEAIQRGSSAPRRSQSSPGVRITPGVPDTGKTREERTEMRPSAPPARDFTLVVADTSKSQQKILNALAWFKSVGITAPTRGQVAFQARVSPKSSGFEKNCSTLRTRGLIDYPAGNRLTLTDAGSGAAHWPDRPGTDEELQQAFYEGVSTPQATLLKHLVSIYPNDIDRETLADAVGVSAASSGFEKNLSTLRSLGLIDYPAPGIAIATELMFIGGNQ